MNERPDPLEDDYELSEPERNKQERDRRVARIIAEIRAELRGEKRPQ